MMTRVLIMLLAGLWSGAASAEAELHYNQVRFQVQATESVTNDRMQAVLVVQDEDADAARLADRVNKTMAWALAQTRDQSGIDVRTGGYSTQPVYKKEALEGWRAIQEVILDGSEFAKIGELIGNLQQRLKLRSVNFSVADATREAVEHRLIEDALDDFKQRAEQVRSNIGTKGYRIVELNLVTEGAPIRPMSMAREGYATMASVDIPSFEGGESEVRVGVQGTVQLE